MTWATLRLLALYLSNPLSRTRILTFTEGSAAFFADLSRRTKLVTHFSNPTPSKIDAKCKCAFWLCRCETVPLPGKRLPRKKSNDLKQLCPPISIFNAHIGSAWGGNRIKNLPCDATAGIWWEISNWPLIKTSFENSVVKVCSAHFLIQTFYREYQRIYFIFYFKTEPVCPIFMNIYRRRMSYNMIIISNTNQKNVTMPPEFAFWTLNILPIL
jgi:hypothetical protein